MQVPEPAEYVPLINCLMDSRGAANAAADCLADLDISTTTAEEVNECANSDEGSNLLHEYGIETKNLDPKLYFVPWIIFNDVIIVYSFLFKNLFNWFRFLTMTPGKLVWMTSEKFFVAIF